MAKYIETVTAKVTPQQKAFFLRRAAEAGRDGNISVGVRAVADRAMALQAVADGYFNERDKRIATMLAEYPYCCPNCDRWATAEELPGFDEDWLGAFCPGCDSYYSDIDWVAHARKAALAAVEAAMEAEADAEEAGDAVLCR